MWIDPCIIPPYIEHTKMVQSTRRRWLARKQRRRTTNDTRWPMNFQGGMEPGNSLTTSTSSCASDGAWRCTCHNTKSYSQFRKPNYSHVIDKVLPNGVIRPQTDPLRNRPVLLQLLGELLLDLKRLVSRLFTVKYMSPLGHKIHFCEI